MFLLLNCGENIVIGISLARKITIIILTKHHTYIKISINIAKYYKLMQLISTKYSLIHSTCYSHAV